MKTEAIIVIHNVKYRTLLNHLPSDVQMSDFPPSVFQTRSLNLTRQKSEVKLLFHPASESLPVIPERHRSFVNIAQVIRFFTGVTMRMLSVC